MRTITSGTPGGKGCTRGEGGCTLGSSNYRITTGSHGEPCNAGPALNNDLSMVFGLQTGRAKDDMDMPVKVQLPKYLFFFSRPPSTLSLHVKSVNASTGDRAAAAAALHDGIGSFLSVHACVVGHFNYLGSLRWDINRRDVRHWLRKTGFGLSYLQNSAAATSFQQPCNKIKQRHPEAGRRGAGWG